VPTYDELALGGGAAVARDPAREVSGWARFFGGLTIFDSGDRN
jgi:hypothetical protein